MIPIGTLESELGLSEDGRNSLTWRFAEVPSNEGLDTEARHVVISLLCKP